MAERLGSGRQSSTTMVNLVPRSGGEDSAVTEFFKSLDPTYFLLKALARVE